MLGPASMSSPDSGWKRISVAEPSGSAMAITVSTAVSTVSAGITISGGSPGNASVIWRMGSTMKSRSGCPALGRPNPSIVTR